MQHRKNEVSEMIENKNEASRNLEKAEREEMQSRETTPPPPCRQNVGVAYG